MLYLFFTFSITVPMTLLALSGAVLTEMRLTGVEEGVDIALIVMCVLVRRVIGRERRVNMDGKAIQKLEIECKNNIGLPTHMKDPFLRHSGWDFVVLSSSSLSFARSYPLSPVYDATGS